MGTPKEGTTKMYWEYIKTIPTRVLIFHYIPTIFLGFPVWGSPSNPFKLQCSGRPNFAGRSKPRRRENGACKTSYPPPLSLNMGFPKLGMYVGFSV